MLFNISALRARTSVPLFVVTCCLIVLVGCGSNNKGKPIKLAIITDKGSDSLNPYCVLLDNKIEPTSYDGIVSISVEVDGVYVYWDTREIKAADFSVERIGRDANRSGLLTYSFNSISYNEMLANIDSQFETLNLGAKESYIYNINKLRKKGISGQTGVLTVGFFWEDKKQMHEGFYKELKKVSSEYDASIKSHTNFALNQSAKLMVELSQLQSDSEGKARIAGYITSEEQIFL
jgi:hypothetical protein